MCGDRRRGGEVVPAAALAHHETGTAPLTMFVLITGSSAADDGVLQRMSSELRGAAGAPRIWRDPEGRCAVASLSPDFTPEDMFDEQPIVDDDKVLVFQGRIDNR